jgi:hypothetical protein
MASSVGNAGWRWEPKAQLTHVESPELGASTPAWTPGHSSQVLRHLVTRVWDDEGINHALAYYMRLGPGWATAGAWAGRELVTDTSLGYRTTDLNIAATANDDAYVAMEVFNWSPAPPESLVEPDEPRIGFRHRTASSWGSVHIVSPDSIARGFNSPNIALQEADNDTLHVMFRRRSDPEKGSGTPGRRWRIPTAHGNQPRG